MTHTPTAPTKPRKLEMSDLTAGLKMGLQDFAANPFIDLFYASFFVSTGLIMGWITYATGTTFWLVLAVLGFPLVGTLAALGFYETSRRRAAGAPITFGSVANLVWRSKNGQLPWLATIIVVIFLFWFFLGHMVFALFLGLAPMTNIHSSLDVFLTADGLTMLAFGSAVGAVFATVIFALSVLGIPMLFDRRIDFMTAIITSLSAVRAAPVLYIAWGVFIAVITIAAMIPFFLGLFIAMPVLGHATWHVYKRVCP